MGASQVSKCEFTILSSNLKCFTFQHLPNCGPLELACVTRALEVKHGCQVKCDGLYADVWYSEEDNQVPDKIENGDAALLNMLKDGELFFSKQLCPSGLFLLIFVSIDPLFFSCKQHSNA